MQKFPCSGCGLCCRSVGKAVEVAKKYLAAGLQNDFVKETAEFPFKYDDSGTCENLLPDNTCAVYETRPDICSVEKTWKKHHSNNISKEDYFRSTVMLCNSMMVEAKVDENFFISFPDKHPEGLV